ncbi:unnamed protein product [Pipistrellus nathusii]|uniref:Transforming acidic coiled-coil-containing protein C-terminal domain-containing protein n=1 Tax=Pipistrellus nathusii TaxID=59473 RepID=A0ABN9ZCB0_PIPNA
MGNEQSASDSQRTSSAPSPGSPPPPGSSRDAQRKPEEQPSAAHGAACTAPEGAAGLDPGVPFLEATERRKHTQDAGAPGGSPRPVSQEAEGTAHPGHQAEGPPEAHARSPPAAPGDWPLAQRPATQPSPGAQGDAPEPAPLGGSPARRGAAASGPGAGGESGLQEERPESESEVALASLGSSDQAPGLWAAPPGGRMEGAPGAGGAGPEAETVDGSDTQCPVKTRAPGASPRDAIGMATGGPPGGALLVGTREPRPPGPPAAQAPVAAEETASGPDVPALTDSAKEPADAASARREPPADPSGVGDGPARAPQEETGGPLDPEQSHEAQQGAPPPPPRALDEGASQLPGPRDEATAPEGPGAAERGGRPPGAEPGGEEPGPEPPGGACPRGLGGVQTQALGRRPDPETEEEASEATGDGSQLLAGMASARPGGQHGPGPSDRPGSPSAAAARSSAPAPAAHAPCSPDGPPEQGPATPPGPEGAWEHVSGGQGGAKPGPPSPAALEGAPGAREQGSPSESKTGSSPAPPQPGHDREDLLTGPQPPAPGPEAAGRGAPAAGPQPPNGESGAADLLRPGHSQQDSPARLGPPAAPRQPGRPGPDAAAPAEPGEEASRGDPGPAILAAAPPLTPAPRAPQEDASSSARPAEGPAPTSEPQRELPPGGLPGSPCSGPGDSEPERPVTERAEQEPGAQEDEAGSRRGAACPGGAGESAAAEARPPGQGEGMAPGTSGDSAGAPPRGPDSGAPGGAAPARLGPAPTGGAPAPARPGPAPTGGAPERAVGGEPGDGTPRLEEADAEALGRPGRRPPAEDSGVDGAAARAAGGADRGDSGTQRPPDQPGGGALSSGALQPEQPPCPGEQAPAPAPHEASHTELPSASTMDTTVAQVDTLMAQVDTPVAQMDTPMNSTMNAPVAQAQVDTPVSQAQVDTLMAQVDIPVNSTVDASVAQVDIPVAHVDTPVAQAQADTPVNSTVDTPVAQVDAPVAQAQVDPPVNSTVDTPVAQVDTPMAQVDVPVAQLDAPVAQADAPVNSTVDSPVAQVNTPMAQVDVPVAQAQVDPPVNSTVDAPVAQAAPSPERLPPAVTPTEAARDAPPRHADGAPGKGAGDGPGGEGPRPAVEPPAASGDAASASRTPAAAPLASPSQPGAAGASEGPGDPAPALASTPPPARGEQRTGEGSAAPGAGPPAPVVPVSPGRERGPERHGDRPGGPPRDPASPRQSGPAPGLPDFREHITKIFEASVRGAPADRPQRPPAPGDRAGAPRSRGGKHPDGLLSPGKLPDGTPAAAPAPVPAPPAGLRVADAEKREQALAVEAEAPHPVPQDPATEPPPRPAGTGMGQDLPGARAGEAVTGHLPVPKDKERPEGGSGRQEAPVEKAAGPQAAAWSRREGDSDPDDGIPAGGQLGPQAEGAQGPAPPGAPEDLPSPTSALSAPPPCGPGAGGAGEPEGAAALGTAEMGAGARSVPSGTAAAWGPPGGPGSSEGPQPPAPERPAPPGARTAGAASPPEPEEAGDARPAAREQRSSDSEEAFETPESTTPVKAPPAPPPPPPEVAPEPEASAPPSPEEPGGGEPAPGPDGPPSVLPVDGSPLRPPAHSCSAVFDEDKPIASSGAYNLDFDSIELVEPRPSDPTASEGPPGAQRRAPGPGPPARAALPRSLSLQAGDLDGAAGPADADTEAAAPEASSDCGSLKRTKRPRPPSLRRKQPPKRPPEAPPVPEAPPAEEGPGPGEESGPPGTHREPAPPEAPAPAPAEEAPLEPAALHPAAGPADTAGTDTAGTDTAGTDTADTVGTDTAGTDTAGTDGAAPPAGGSVQNSPPTGRKAAPAPAPEAAGVTLAESGPPEDAPARGGVRLEFDYSEDGGPEAAAARKPGRKPGARMPLRRPKAKKGPEPGDAPAAPPRPPAEPGDAPAARGAYSFDADKWDDPDFNPFSSASKMQASPKLPPPAAFGFPPEARGEPAEPGPAPGSPAQAPASFEIPVGAPDGHADGDGAGKPAKKKKAPLKTDTFRVKKSPKRSPLSDPPSQDPTPAATPEAPPVIAGVVHATDEEKLAVTSQKWACMTVELEADKQDFPQPSDLSSFVNETKFSSPSEELDYRNAYEIEYMEKIGSSLPEDDAPKKQALYLMFDTTQGSPVRSPPTRTSESPTPCSGSPSFEEAEALVTAGAKGPPPASRGLAPGPEKPPQKELEARAMGPTAEGIEMTAPEGAFASADALLSRLADPASLCGTLDYLEPDLAEKNPPVFAQKLQEELEFAVMRIEALKLARQIALASRSRQDAQREAAHPAEVSLSKAALYSRLAPAEPEKAPSLLFPPPDLDAALQGARAEVLAKEREVSEWKAKHEESRREVMEMRKIVAEYEKTIAQMIEDEQREKSASRQTVQQLVLEKEQALADLNSVEKSLADLFRRYEKMKAVLEGFRKNEEVLKKCAQEYLSRVKKEEQRYQALKVHAEEKLDRANAEIAQVRGQAQQEQAAFQASLRKGQLRVDALERTLEQKNKEIEELTKICDELIAKMGRS